MPDEDDQEYEELLNEKNIITGSSSMEIYDYNSDQDIDDPEEETMSTSLLKAAAKAKIQKRGCRLAVPVIGCTGRKSMEIVQLLNEKL